MSPRTLSSKLSPAPCFTCSNIFSFLVETSVWPSLEHLCMLHLPRVRGVSMWPSPLAFAVRSRTWLPIKTHTLKASPQEEGGLDVEQRKNDGHDGSPMCGLASIPPASAAHRERPARHLQIPHPAPGQQTGDPAGCASQT